MTLTDEILFKIKLQLLNLTAQPLEPPKKVALAFLKFTEKDIRKMPKPFRKPFRMDGSLTHIKKYKDEQNELCYEIRYSHQPFKESPIYASGATIEEAKAKFINYVTERYKLQ